MNFLRIITNRKVFFSIYLFSHGLFSYLLGAFHGFAPDETGYIYTLINLYGSSPDQNPQLGSGWIATSKPFLWVAYLPAQILLSVGLPDYLAIRLLSVFIGLVTLILLDSIRSQKHILELSEIKRVHPVLICFFIPSIFLWQSLGLRESFLLLEITMVLVGLHKFLQEGRLSSIILAGVGSFGLLSTKNYQWIFLALAILGAIGIQLLLKKPKFVYFHVFITVIIIPAVLYASTTSTYALTFFMRSNIEDVSKRSGDSISIVTVKPKPEDTEGTNLGSDPLEDLVIRVHGDSTTISLYRYLEQNKQSFSSKLISMVGITRIVEKEYESLISNATLNAGKNADKENQHILEPGSIEEPLKLMKSMIAFALGPLPLNPDYGLFLKMISLESPLWWVLVGMLLNLLRKKKSFKVIFQDLSLLIAFTYLGIVVVTSGITEVNLGTSFRHRSLILVPLIFIYICIKDIKSGNKNRDE